MRNERANCETRNARNADECNDRERRAHYGNKLILGGTIVQKLRLADDEVQNRKAADPSAAFQSSRVRTERNRVRPFSLSLSSSHSLGRSASARSFCRAENYRGISPVCDSVKRQNVKMKARNGGPASIILGLGMPSCDVTCCRLN